MNNYVYIVSSLPELIPDLKPGASLDTDGILEEILSQCSEKDAGTVRLLLDGFDPDKLGAGFYESALSHPSRFIREYFAKDLEVRNAKAAYLNSALGRPDGLDQVFLEEDPEPYEMPSNLREMLSVSDILVRERSLDTLMWDTAENLTTLDYFDLDAILGFIARLKIASRWAVLDEQTGREMFRKLSESVRETFKGVEFES